MDAVAAYLFRSESYHIERSIYTTVQICRASDGRGRTKETDQPTFMVAFCGWLIDRLFVCVCVLSIFRERCCCRCRCCRCCRSLLSIVVVVDRCCRRPLSSLSIVSVGPTLRPRSLLAAYRTRLMDYSITEELVVAGGGLLCSPHGFGRRRLVEQLSTSTVGKMSCRCGKR